MKQTQGHTSEEMHAADAETLIKLVETAYAPIVTMTSAKSMIFSTAW